MLFSSCNERSCAKLCDVTSLVGGDNSAAKSFGIKLTEIWNENKRPLIKMTILEYGCSSVPRISREISYKNWDGVRYIGCLRMNNTIREGGSAYMTLAKLGYINDDSDVWILSCTMLLRWVRYMLAYLQISAILCVIENLKVTVVGQIFWLQNRRKRKRSNA